jgi:hypothetical protein
MTLENEDNAEISENRLRSILHEKHKEPDADDKGGPSDCDADDAPCSKKKSKGRKGKTVSEEVTDENINEAKGDASLAAASLHPAARSVSDSKSLNATKVEIMKRMVNHAAGMSKSDLTDWFEKSMAIYGPGKSHGVGDVSGKNSASIDSHLGKGPKTKTPMPKLNVREDIEEMFAGSELSEDFKEKSAVIFEAAVEARVIIERTKLEEDYAEALREEVEEFTEGLTDRVDAYMDYVVENWMKDNSVAIESTLRNELMGEFIEGLKNLFTEHYIDIPETKVDIVEAMSEKINDLQEQNSALIVEKTRIQDALVNEIKTDIFEDISAELTLVDKEKLKNLSEGVEFNGDVDDYHAKLELVRDNYFSSAKKAPAPSNILEESFETTEDTTTKVSDPAVKRYADIISRTVKPNIQR